MNPDPCECPASEALEALAARREAGADLQSDPAWAHVSRCPACTKYLEAAAFANRFSSVMGPSGAPPKHAPRSAAPSAFATPTLPGYRIIHEIARGGQGVVYRGVQHATGQPVAIKVIPTGAQSSIDRDRFAREIQIAGSLAHPGVVRIFDSFTLPDGRAALIMELVDGLTLDRWLAARPRRGDVIELLAQVADALHHAHQRGVIHRDLKPSNIIVDHAGRPHILDFGVACWTQSQVARLDLAASRILRLTRTGAFAGTLAYAAPEQLSLEATIPDIRSDVYALGVIAYEALLGDLPYPIDGSLETVVGHIVRTEPRTPVRGAIDHDLWTVIAKALAKEPPRRYQTAASLADDLRNAAAGRVIDARRDSAWYVLRKTARRHRLPVLLGAVTIFATFAVLATLAISNAKLARALHESTMDRLRTAAATGDRGKAESILWSDLPPDDASARAAPDPWDGPPRRRDAIWAFIQMQAAGECRAVAALTQVPQTITPLSDARIALCNLDSSVDIVSLSDMSMRRVAPAAPLPGQVGFVTASGARAVTLFAEVIQCRELGPGGGLFRAALSPAAAGERTLRVVEDRIALGSPDGRINVHTLPRLEPVFEVSDAIPTQTPWLDLQGRWLAYIARSGEFVLVDTTGAEPGVRVPGIEPSSIPEGGRGLYIWVNVFEDLSRGLISSLNGVHVIDLAGSAPRPLPGGPSYRVAMNLSPDASVLSLASGGDSRLRLWNTATWSELPSLGGHAESVLLHAVMPGNREIVTIDRSATLRLWRIPGRGWRSTLSRPTATVQDLALSPAGGTLYFGGPDGGLWAVSTVDAAPTSTPRDRRIADAGLTIACDAASGRLAFAGGDDRIRMATQAGNTVDPMIIRAPGAQRVHSLRFSPSGDRLAVCTLEGTLMIIDALAAPGASGSTSAITSSVALGPGGDAPIAAAVRWSPDARTIAVAMRDGSIVFTDPDLRSVERPVVSPLQIRGIDFSPDSRTLAAVGNDGEVIIIDVPRRAVRSRLRISDQTLFSVAFHPGGHTLAVGDRSGRVMFVDPSRPALLATLTASGPVTSLLFTPDAGSLFVGALSAGVERWDLQDLARTIEHVRPDARPVLRPNPETTTNRETSTDPDGVRESRENRPPPGS